jgi:hypothetical protein
MRIRSLFLATLPLLATLAIVRADDDPAWKAKEISEWSEQDAKDLLTESPWVKTFTPTLKQQQQQNNGTERRGMGGGGMGGGIGVGGIGIGIPGMGGGRRGMGYPGGGYPNGGNGGGQQGHNNPTEPPKLTLRWESAMPVRSAELKSHDLDAPTLDDKHYAIAVYGVPENMLVGERRKLADQLKGKAAIRRDGKKDMKPSSVDVIDRPDGPVVVYMFPVTNEITKGDRRLEFDADMGRLELTQSFFTEDMVWQGKLEL